MNISFKDKGAYILSPDIMSDFIDEMRKERKVQMVLKDTNFVDYYIGLDMSSVDMELFETDTDFSEMDLDRDLFLECKKKFEFR